MPSTMTHSYFAIDIYNNLNSKYKNKISNLDQLNYSVKDLTLLCFITT